jgi:hypothetical protein
MENLFPVHAALMELNASWSTKQRFITRFICTSEYTMNYFQFWNKLVLNLCIKILFEESSRKSELKFSKFYRNWVRSF